MRSQFCTTSTWMKTTTEKKVLGAREYLGYSKQMIGYQS